MLKPRTRSGAAMTADSAEAQREYGVSLLPAMPVPGLYDALVVAVAHDEFKQLGIAGLRNLSAVNRTVRFSSK